MRSSIAACLTFILVAGCSGDEDGQPVQPANTVVLDGRVANDRGSRTLEPGESPTVAAGDFYFEPTVMIGPPGGPIDIAAPRGTQVEVMVASEGQADHNISIEEQDIDVDIASGETARLVVTFPDSGTLVFVCRYHHDRGMAGALVAS
jgi:Cupredoxin-like domain